MSEVTVYKYAGSTPGTDSSTYVLFSTVVAFPGARGFVYAGIKRFRLGLEHSHLGTINAYRSPDRGTTWHQLSTTAVAAPAANSTNEYDFLVEGYDDWKVEWVNGGTTQSPWSIVLVASDERSVAD